jgi:hypothetical protein
MFSINILNFIIIFIKNFIKFIKNVKIVFLISFILNLNVNMFYGYSYHTNTDSYGGTSIKNVNMSFVSNVVVTSSGSTSFGSTAGSSSSSGSSSSNNHNALANHYQVITICNSLPSILKCQNRQHFLILHRVIYGLSNTTSYYGPGACIPQTACMQVDESDQFNCTGSNICVFYPIDRSLNTCRNLESNLTQIHITCVSLMHFKRYYNQLYRKNVSIDQMNRTNENFNQTYTNNFFGAKDQHQITTPSRLTTINTTITSTHVKPLEVFKLTPGSEFTFIERNSIIFIVLSVITSLMGVLLFLLVYYKIK